MADDQTGDLPDESLPLELLAQGFWKGRYAILSYSIVGLFFSVIYLAVAQSVYTASATITVSSDTAPTPSSGASIASSLGLDVGGKLGGDFANYINGLHSARLAEHLEAKYHIMPRLFSGWNEATRSWDPPGGFSPVTQAIKGTLGLPLWQAPTAVSLAEYLGINIQVASTGGTTSTIRVISYDSADPKFARYFLGLVIKGADDVIRGDKLVNVKNRIAYLQKSIDNAHEFYMRQSLLDLLFSEQRKLMILQADKFYSIDVLDPPSVAVYPTKPRPMIVLALGVSVGLLVGILAVVLALRRRFLRAGDDSYEMRLKEPFSGPFSPITGAIRKLFGR
jgi:hypothetical protein